METRIAKLLNEYGDSRFGDEWWPKESKAWLDEKRAGELGQLFVGGIDDGKRAVELINSYGVAKFGHKWQPDLAESVLGHEKATELRNFLGSEPEPYRPGL